MASAVERTDDLVREYLIYRGFTTALKQLDAEIKADKEKGFRVGGSQGETKRKDPRVDVQGQNNEGLRVKKTGKSKMLSRRINGTSVLI